MSKNGNWLADLDAEELAAAWDLWSGLAHATNDDDPPYAHGGFVELSWEDLKPDRSAALSSAPVGERSR